MIYNPMPATESGLNEGDWRLCLFPEIIKGISSVDSFTWRNEISMSLINKKLANESFTDGTDIFDNAPVDKTQARKN